VVICSGASFQLTKSFTASTPLDGQDLMASSRLVFLAAMHA